MLLEDLDPVALAWFHFTLGAFIGLTVVSIMRPPLVRSLERRDPWLAGAILAGGVLRRWPL